VDYGVLASLFVVGLLGTVHCLGMCGGIVTALSVGVPGTKPKSAARLAYHAGRLTTYSAAGALAGAAGSAALLAADLFPVQLALYVAAQLMLVALGLYLLGVTRVLGALERAGARLWRRVQPAAGRLLPLHSAARAYAAGALWGMLPCGLVYSVLATALTAGSPLGGAAAMLAFGVGTTPGLLGAGALVPLLERARRAELVRRAAGAAVIAFGILGLAHAGRLTPPPPPSDGALQTFAHPAHR
jgi:sulfite exporter TauE/SafE